MVRVQRVDIDGQDSTWTVLARDHLPLVEAERFLEYLRQTDRSPNTVKSYARALALWWEFLELRGTRWDQVAIGDLTGFLAWLRTGLPPGMEPLRRMPHRVADSTVAVRLQAVRSFYQFQQLRGVDVAGWMWMTGNRHWLRYVPFLAHARRGAPRVATVRVARRRRSAPTLTPRQMQLIKDRCGRFDPEAGYG
jgi:Phage integrase, N-terminal SAM-like domain